ncbi:MAG TPA: ABC transporter permease, partial [Allocoleopsis sp.]
QMLLVFNLMLFLCLIVALSPHRQAMQDWARYRHQMRSTRKKGIMSDLIWGEKSPAVVAIGLNLAIASVTLLTWIVFWSVNEYQIPALWGLLLTCSVIFIYAVVAQLMLLMKAQKRVVWAAVTVGSLVILPPVILGFLSISPTESERALAWMFSAMPWAAVENATGMSVFLAIIGQSLITGLLTLQLTRQLQKAGESSTKALLSGRSSMATR